MNISHYFIACHLAILARLMPPLDIITFAQPADRLAIIAMPLPLYTLIFAIIIDIDAITPLLMILRDTLAFDICHWLTLIRFTPFSDIDDI